MTKAKKIQFWIVKTYDPTAEMHYEKYEGFNIQYVRTKEEAKKLVIDHTIQFMPEESDAELDAAWKAYREWTPFNPQTGEPNKPIPQPKKHNTLPLYDFSAIHLEGCKEAYTTRLNDLAHKIGYDNLDISYNEDTWDGTEPIAMMYLHTIE